MWKSLLNRWRDGHKRMGLIFKILKVREGRVGDFMRPLCKIAFFTFYQLHCILCNVCHTTHTFSVNVNYPYASPIVMWNSEYLANTICHKFWRSLCRGDKLGKGEGRYMSFLSLITSQFQIEWSVYSDSTLFGSVDRFYCHSFWNMKAVATQHWANSYSGMG